MEDEKKRILESQQSTEKRYGRTDRPRVDPSIVRINPSSGVFKATPQQPAPVPSLTLNEKKSNPYLQAKTTPSPGTASAKQHIITLAATKQTKQNIQPMKKPTEQPKQTPPSIVSSMHGTNKLVSRPPGSAPRPQQPGMPQKPRVNEQASVQQTRPSSSSTNQAQNKNRPERPLQQTLKPILDPKSLQMQTLKYGKQPPAGSQLQKTGATFTMASKVGVQKPLVKRPEQVMAKVIDKKELVPKEFQRITPNGIHKNKVSDVHKYNTMKSTQKLPTIVKTTNSVAAPVTFKTNESAPAEIVKPRHEHIGIKVDQKPKIIMQQAQIIQIKAGQQPDSVMMKERVQQSLAPIVNVVRDVVQTQETKQQPIILDVDMADQPDAKSVDESEHESDQEMQDDDAKEQVNQEIGQAIHPQPQVAAQMHSSGLQVQTEKNLVINIDMPQTKDKEDDVEQSKIQSGPKEEAQVLPKIAQEELQSGTKHAEPAPRFTDEKNGQVPNILHPKFGKKIAAPNVPVPAENAAQNYQAQDQLVQSTMQQNQQQPMLQVNNQQQMPVQKSYIEDLQSKQIQFQQQLIFQLYQAYIQQRFYNEQIHQQLSMQSMQAQLSNAQGNNFQAQNLGMNPQNGQMPSYLSFNTLSSTMPQQFIPMNSQPLILQPGAAPGMIPQLKPFNGAGNQMPGMMEMMNRFGQQNMGDSQGMNQTGHQINQDASRMVQNAMIQQQMLYPNQQQQQPQQLQMQQMAQQMQQQHLQHPSSSPNDPPIPIVAQHQNQKPESLLKQPDLAPPVPPTNQHQLLNTNQPMDMQMHIADNFDNSDLAKPFNSDLAKPFDSDIAKPFSMKPLPEKQPQSMPTSMNGQIKVNENVSEETNLIAPLPVSQILSSQSAINRVSQPQPLAPPQNLPEKIKVPSNQQIQQPFLQPIKELINSEKQQNLMPPSSGLAQVDNSDLRPQFNTNPPDLQPKQQSPDQPDPQPQARPLEQPKEQEKETPKSANPTQEEKPPNFTESVQNEQPIRPLKPLANIQQQGTPGQEKGKIENYMPQQQPNVQNRAPQEALSQCLVGKEVFFDVHVDQQFPNIFREKNIKQPFSMFRIKTKIDAKASQLSNTLIERLNAVAKKDPQIANLNIDKRHINLYFHCDKGDRWWFENTQRVADIINSGFWHPSSIVKSEKGKSAKRIYFVICKTC